MFFIFIHSDQLRCAIQHATIVCSFLHDSKVAVAEVGGPSRRHGCAALGFARGSDAPVTSTEEEEAAAAAATHRAPDEEEPGFVALYRWIVGV